MAEHPGYDIIQVRANDPNLVEREDQLVSQGYTCYSKNGRNWNFRREKTPVKATAAAQQLAREHGVDLTTIAGTGADDVITRTDVEAALATENPADRPRTVAHMPPVRGLPGRSGPSGSGRVPRRYRRFCR